MIIRDNLYVNTIHFVIIEIVLRQRCITIQGVPEFWPRRIQILQKPGTVQQQVRVQVEYRAGSGSGLTVRIWAQREREIKNNIKISLM